MYYLDQGAYIYFVYTSPNSVVIDANLNYNNEIVIIPGDTNLDQLVNVQDIVNLIYYILELVSFNQVQLDSADIDNSGLCNINDIVMIIEIILDTD